MMIRLLAAGRKTCGLECDENAVCKLDLQKRYY